MTPVNLNNLYTSRMQPFFSILYNGKPKKRCFKSYSPTIKTSAPEITISAFSSCAKISDEGEADHRYLFATTLANGNPRIVVGEKFVHLS